jgi:hypothetical protein
MDRRELQRAVVRGIKFLDKKDPDWWKNGTTPNGIDITRLELMSPTACVLGQRRPDRHGTWDDTLASYGLSGDAATDYGFQLFFEDFENTTYSQRAKWYSILTELWIAIIEARRHPRRTKGIPAWITPSLRKPPAGITQGPVASKS